MDEEEKSQGIKVVDKRRFDDSGSAREDSDSGSSKVAASTSGSTTGATSAAERPKSAPPASAEGGGADDGIESQPRRASGSPAVNFNNFVLGLGTQALVLMGEIPNPETGLVSANLSAAKQTIDILGILEAKTTGNLDEDEGKLLTEVLSSLRLAFVNRVNSKS